MAEWWEDANDSAVDWLNDTANTAGGIIGSIVNRGPSSTSASAPTTTPEDDNERWRQGLIGEQQRAAEKARIADQYGPPAAVDKEAIARAGLLGLQQSEVQLRMDKLNEDIRQAQSPEAKQLLQSQIDVAKAQLARANLELERAKGEMTQEERLWLEDRLTSGRERMRQEFESAKSDKDYDRAVEREKLNFQRQLARDDQQFGRDLMRDQMNLGVSVRGQELQRLKAQDDFVMNMLQNQISAGRLSLDKAAKQFEGYVTKARLPSEIMSNVSRAIEPLIPYMTPYKAGDIPMGFETGGSRDVIGRLGGNAPGSYNPSQYAVKPVTVDPFALAKQAGADFSQTKVPDPGKVFGGVSVPSVPSGGTSATSQLGNVGQYSGQIAGMQQNMVGALPPGIGPTAEEQQALLKALGG